MKQLVLSTEMKKRVEHGGSLSRGKRKVARPIATKRAMHITVRSSHAKGALSFHARQNAPFIRRLIPVLAKRFGLRLYNWSLNSNHIHLCARAETRRGFKQFLMALTGSITQKITGARKGKPLGYRFFDFIPWTRIVEWGRAYQTARSYVYQNELEAQGLIPYRRRRAPRSSLARLGPAHNQKQNA